MNGSTVIRMGTLLLAVLVGGLTGRADSESVQSPNKRHESLEKAKSLLTAKETAAVSADPFHSEAFTIAVTGARPQTEKPAEPTAGPRSERDLLQAIAASLKPTGNFVIGGQPTIVFGQKKVKSGSSLTITFEGTEYTLEVVSVDRTSFTLRLNREEFTRPIK